MPLKKIVNAAIKKWNEIVADGNKYHKANYTKYKAAVDAGMARDPEYEKKFKKGNKAHDSLKINKWD